MIDRLVTDLMEVTEVCISKPAWGRDRCFARKVDIHRCSTPQDLLSKDSGAAHLAKLTTKTHHDSHSEKQIGDVSTSIRIEYS